MLATCQLSASFCYHAEFQEVCYQKQENGRFVARSRHGVCESGFNTAGERHGMCESALNRSYALSLCDTVHCVTNNGRQFSVICQFSFNFSPHRTYFLFKTSPQNTPRLNTRMSEDIKSATISCLL